MFTLVVKRLRQYPSWSSPRWSAAMWSLEALMTRPLVGRRNHFLKSAPSAAITKYQQKWHQHTVTRANVQTGEQKVRHTQIRTYKHTTLGSEFTPAEKHMYTCTVGQINIFVVKRSVAAFMLDCRFFRSGCRWSLKSCNKCQWGLIWIKFPTYN